MRTLSLEDRLQRPCCEPKNGPGGRGGTPETRCVVLFAPPIILVSDSGRKFFPSDGVRGYIQEEETVRPYFSSQGCLSLQGCPSILPRMPQYQVTWGNGRK
ncbi:hypothetical protein ACLKA6_010485 [Drosophila palustris]